MAATKYTEESIKSLEWHEQKIEIDIDDHSARVPYYDYEEEQQLKQQQQQ